MDNRLLFAFLATITLFLAGCGPGSSSPDLTDPFVGGTEGLQISWMEGAPPAEIYDGGQLPFSVNLIIKNVGESAVGAGADQITSADRSDNTFAGIELVGINPSQFGNPITEKTFEQENILVGGARKTFDGTVISGETSVMTFDGFSYLPDARGNDQITMRANLCYDYTTYANARVCIKDNVLENIQDSSICTLAGAKVVKNSGSPVHVTEVTQNPQSRDRIQVTFTIQNVGTGQIFRRSGVTDVSDACDTSITNPDRNYVYVNVYFGDDSGVSTINCPLLGNSNEGFVQLFQGSAVRMSCTVFTDPSRGRVFTDTMHIDLDYTYLTFIEQPILIRDVSVGSPANP